VLVGHYPSPKFRVAHLRVAALRIGDEVLLIAGETLLLGRLFAIQ
jgi:hypothetical protein